MSFDGCLRRLDVAILKVCDPRETSRSAASGDGSREL